MGTNTPAHGGTTHLPDAVDTTGDTACPRCGGSVFRIHRRLVDLLISKFVYVQRYRCCSRRCGWEGNRTIRSALPPVASVAATRLVRPLTRPEPSQELSRLALDSLGDAVLGADLAARVNYLNRAAEIQTGWTSVEAHGRPFTDVCRILEAGSRTAADDGARQAIAANARVEPAGNFVLVRRDGSESAIELCATPMRDGGGQVVGAVIAVRDVGPSRALALSMSRLAHHDALTGLPNRLLLAERLNQALGQARRHRTQVSLLFVDLDCFKQINDTLGHEVGDLLLTSVADRMRECVRSTDTACRIGGDEFVILLAEIAQPRDAMRVAMKLLRAFAAPHRFGGHVLQVSLSIGISVFPDDGDTADVIIGNADSAMYRAKTGGGNAYRFFMADMEARATQHLLPHGDADGDILDARD